MFSALSAHSAANNDLEVLGQRTTPRRRRRSSSVSTVTAGRDEADNIDDIFELEVIDLTEDSCVARKPRPGQRHQLSASLRVGDDVIRSGDFIEVRDMQMGHYPVNFVLVDFVAHALGEEDVIRGIPYTRNRNLGGKLAKKPSEVCRLVLLDDNDRDEGEGALVDVKVQDVVKKRTVLHTNTVWPKHSSQFDSVQNQRQRRLAVESIGTLICRWKFLIYGVKQGRTSKTVEEALVRLASDEVQPQYRDEDADMCQQWRGGRVRGGSWKPAASSQDGSMDMTMGDGTIHRSHRSTGQKYTLFDSFSGAGGVSRGAQMAGFRVSHAVDKAEEVWPTYEANFPSTRLFRGPIHEYIHDERRPIRVDILHLSPPCQYFSPAHTHMSANDDQNIFALFSCNSLIDKVRPRLITVEQTFGLMHERHQEYLRILISDFTQFGYSVRWKIVRLCTWGSSQDRKRLIMLAAAPGEKLPPFPPATHSENGEGGLKPYTTIAHALAPIRPRDDLHDIQGTRVFNPPRMPYDPNRLAGTITTGGAELGHPSGTRDFTLREYASLQGFPRYHKFMGHKTSIKRQIGNAFPPNTVHVLYKFLEDWLLKEDGMSAYHIPERDVVMLDAPAEMGRHKRAGAIIVDDSDTQSDVSPWNSSGSPPSSPNMDDVMEIDNPDEICIVERPRIGGRRHLQKAAIDLTNHRF